MRAKALVVFLLALAAYVGAHAWRPTVYLAETRAPVNLERMFPKRFGSWVVDDRVPVQLVSPDTAELLNKLYNQTISRTYVNPQGQRIMLSVAYGGDQSDGTRAHRPEVCYPSQGFDILGNTISQMHVLDRTLPVRRLLARQGGRIEPITYWMTIGERTAVSGTALKLAQLSYSSRGLIADGMLVRISSIDLDSARAYNLHQQFIDELAQAAPPDQRGLMLGTTGG